MAVGLPFYKSLDETGLSIESALLSNDEQRETGSSGLGRVAPAYAVAARIVSDFDGRFLIIFLSSLR